MNKKETQAGIKINRLLEQSTWRFEGCVLGL